ncbi:unnamed protein product, partial [Brassica rapa subsp. narinosa]
KLGLQQLTREPVQQIFASEGVELVPPDRDRTSIPAPGCRSPPRTPSGLTSLVDNAVAVKTPYMLTPRTGGQTHLLLTIDLQPKWRFHATQDLLLWESHRRLGEDFRSGRGKYSGRS